MADMYIRDSGSWKKYAPGGAVKTLYVKHPSGWIRPSSAYVRTLSGGSLVWEKLGAEELQFYLNTPSAPVFAPDTSRPVTELAFRVDLTDSGGPVDVVALNVYQYDSSGGSRTFLKQVRSETLDRANQPTQLYVVPKGLAPNTKYGFTSVAVRYPGPSETISAESAETRVKTGTEAVVDNNSPVYGWGPMSGWLRPSQVDGLSVASNLSTYSPGHPMSDIDNTASANYYMLAGNGDVYPGTARRTDLGGGALSPVRVWGRIYNSDGTPADGGSGTVPYVRVTASKKIMIDALYVSYIGLRGSPQPNLLGLLVDGVTLWDLDPSFTPMQSSQTVSLPGGTGLDQPFTYAFQGVYWGTPDCQINALRTPMGISMSPGDYLQARCRILPVWNLTSGGVFESRMSARATQVKVRQWVVTGYTSVVTTPKVHPSTW